MAQGAYWATLVPGAEGEAFLPQVAGGSSQHYLPQESNLTPGSSEGPKEVPIAPSKQRLHMLDFKQTNKKLRTRRYIFTQI